MDWTLKTSSLDIQNPTWEQIYKALLEMDGTSINEVELQQIGFGSLLIEGGDNKHYLVVYFPEEDAAENYSVTLVDEALEGPNVWLTVQTRQSYPARMAIPFSLLVQVVEFIYRSGSLPQDREIGETVVWEA